MGEYELGLTREYVVSIKEPSPLAEVLDPLGDSCFDRVGELASMKRLGRSVTFTESRCKELPLLHWGN